MSTKRGFWARLWRALLFLVIGWLVLSIAAVLLLRWVNPPTTAFIVEDRLAANFSGDKNYRYRHAWVGWERICDSMKLAVMASEDQKFPEHHGFDIDSIDDAIRERERGGRVRGASTISQQTAKNLFLWPGQSWIRKGFEVYFTLLLEALWSKQRILEVYLNVAEFGKGTFGVGAASPLFFHKPAAQLTSYESALLAATLPSPKRLHADAPSHYLQQRAEWIIAQMRRLGGASYLDEL